MISVRVPERVPPPVSSMHMPQTAPARYCGWFMAAPLCVFCEANQARGRKRGFVDDMAEEKGLVW